MMQPSVNSPIVRIEASRAPSTHALSTSTTTLDKQHHTDADSFQQVYSGNLLSDYSTEVICSHILPTWDVLDLVAVWLQGHCPSQDSAVLQLSTL